MSNNIDIQTSTLYRLISSQTAVHPEKIAITGPMAKPRTYRQLDNQIRYFLSALKIMGFKRNDRIAVVLQNGPDLAVAFVSVVCGFTAVPLNDNYRYDEFKRYLSVLRVNALLVKTDSGTEAVDAAINLAIPVIEEINRYRVVEN